MHRRTFLGCVVVGASELFVPPREIVASTKKIFPLYPRYNHPNQGVYSVGCDFASDNAKEQMVRYFKIRAWDIRFPKDFYQLRMVGNSGVIAIPVNS